MENRETKERQGQTGDDHGRKTLHMIGNAHLDPVWFWRWQEGFQEVKATFRSVLDRMKEYDDFFFTGSSAAYYAWIEENEPEMFEEIRARVREGRWSIVGGWWIQPDCNIPGGESFVRQGLYGQRYFKEKFGVTASTGYNVDSFGHNGTLPQILKKSGMDRYVFMRPGRHEKGIERADFWWRANDGSKVQAFRIPFEYCTWPKEIREHVLRCAGEIKEDAGILMCFYGVGNHGGGPTRQNIDSIHAMNEEEGMPKLLLSTPDRYFDALCAAGGSPVTVSGDLLHHASGCYSAHSGVKRLNRQAENRLTAAEKLSAAAGIWADRKYPLQEYTRAWKEVLFNQFHDILAGTCVEAAYEDAAESYGEALNIAAKEMNRAVQALSWRVDIPMEEGMKPIVVFNPNAFAETFEIEIESAAPEEGTVLLDEEDAQLPVQCVQSQASSNGRVRLTFAAKLPPLGYRTFRLARREQARRFAEVEATDVTAENRWFKVAFDRKTGAIASLTRKDDQTEYFSGPAALPTVIEDKSDTWSHGVRIFNKVRGVFTPVSVKKIESGPVKAVIRVTSGYGASRIVQDFSIYRELDYIRVQTMVDWHEKHSMLKLVFPMNMNYLRATWETPYGTAQREPDGEEYPVQSFLDVEGAAPGLETMIHGISFLNDGKSSASIAGKEVGLTVLRSPIYANHEPYEPKEGMEYVYLDQGVQRFEYVIYPHRGSWENARTARLGRALNEKPAALFETYHRGVLPQSASLVQVDRENVLLTVVKGAEDGSGDWILRLVETAGRACRAQVRMEALGRSFVLPFAPFEIKTVRVPAQADLEPEENNLLEYAAQGGGNAE